MTEPEVSEQETPTEDPNPNPNREAARWRTELREVQAKLDASEAKHRARDRAELVRLATTGDGPRLHDANDLWPDDGDTDYDGLRGDDGELDPSIVAGTIQSFTAEKPYLRADIKVRRSDPSQGAGLHTSPAPTWSDVITNR